MANYFILLHIEVDHWRLERLVLQHLRKVSDKYLALSRQLLPYYAHGTLLYLILVHQIIKQNKDFPRPLKIRRNIVLQKQQSPNTYLNKPFTAKISPRDDVGRSKTPCLNKLLGSFLAQLFQTINAIRLIGYKLNFHVVYQFPRD